jgi:O-6-methylguanine DNA methyltransferase
MTTLPDTSLPITTPAGSFVAHYSAHGLAALDFPTAKSKTRKQKQAGTVPPIPAMVRRWHTLTTKALKATLAGKTPTELPPLDVSIGTEFQQRVWEELLWIPHGESRSYAEIAKTIRRPKAVRAVGGACGANPIPLLIPCHRVLAAHGKIGGYSGGMEWKRKLLSLEGTFEEDVFAAAKPVKAKGK